MPIGLAALERRELAHLPVATTWPTAAAMYGLCDGGDARGLFADVVRDVIIPQLEALGLAVERSTR